jgi:zinc protease
MLWVANCTYDTKVNPDSIIALFDKAVDELSAITKADLDLALVKLRSEFYDRLSFFGKVDLLASFALFDNDPGKINALEDAFKKISPALVKKTAKEYLRKTNRTILIIDPKANKP